MNKFSIDVFRLYMSVKFIKWVECLYESVNIWNCLYLLFTVLSTMATQLKGHK